MSKSPDTGVKINGDAAVALAKYMAEELDRKSVHMISKGDGRYIFNVSEEDFNLLLNKVGSTETSLTGQLHDIIEYFRKKGSS